MQLTFEAVFEARPGPKWQVKLKRYWPDYRAWPTRRSGPQQPSPSWTHIEPSSSSVGQKTTHEPTWIRLRRFLCGA